jgi:hypothetical protein
MRWKGHVARMGERCIEGSVEKTLRNREKLEDPALMEG